MLNAVAEEHTSVGIDFVEGLRERPQKDAGKAIFPDQRSPRGLEPGSAGAALRCLFYDKLAQLVLRPSPTAIPNCGRETFWLSKQLEITNLRSAKPCQYLGAETFAEMARKPGIVGPLPRPDLHGFNVPKGAELPRFLGWKPQET